MHARHEALVARFIEAAERDARLVAVALVGSNATGHADEHSDLDLFLVTEDADFEAFIADRDAFLTSVDRPLFIESWGHRDRWFFVYEGGADGELTVIPAGKLVSAFDAPFIPLLDKRGVLAGIEATTPVPRPVGPEQRTEIQRRLDGFWHDYAHFVTAWGRSQWWWANGQLEALRGRCANLLRLAANPTDPEVGDEPYWKVELTLPPSELRRLEPTLNTFDPGSMLQAGTALAALYRELAVQLVETHSLQYPDALERAVLVRLTELRRG